MRSHNSLKKIDLLLCIGPAFSFLNVFCFLWHLFLADKFRYIFGTKIKKKDSSEKRSKKLAVYGQVIKAYDQTCCRKLLFFLTECRIFLTECSFVVFG